MIKIEDFFNYPPDTIIKSFIKFDEKNGKWYKYVVKKGNQNTFYIRKSINLFLSDNDIILVGTLLTDSNQIRLIADCTIAVLKYYNI